ncbi:MAG: hypothetical protein KDK89_00360 [Alphaproteobacteria bacterium]|nr:hypothetical protein [Alphaproteobacteria bacterium]
MGGLFCGIDIGTTNLKVLLLDGGGRTAWVKSISAPRLNDGLGVVTDAAALVGTLEEVIIEGWQAVGGGVPLAAIATTGTGEDGIGVTGDLKPLCHAIAWWDKRAVADGEALNRLPETQAHPEIRFDFCRTGSKWLWLRRERPEDLREARFWLTLTDYPACIWAGEPFISETLAARTGCYDVFARDWIAPLLRLTKAPPMPRVLKAGDIIGTMRPGALRAAGAASAQTVLAVGGHDHPLASSALRRIHPLARVDSLGTANGTYGETTTPRHGTAESGLELSVPVAGGPGVAMIGPTEFAVIIHATTTDDDFIRSFLAQPHLPGTPNMAGDDPAARLRRAFESVTFRARAFLRAMAQFGVPAGPLYSTGGWTRSTALVELRASIYGEPVIVIDEPELTVLSAALFAGEATLGQAPDFARHHCLVTVDPRQDWVEAYRD